MRKRFIPTAISAHILVPVLAVLMALGIGAILIIAVGGNPLGAYWSLFEGAFGSRSGIAETGAIFIPLLILSLGLAVAFRCHLWNMGAEGQMYMGALAGVLVALYFPGLPAALLIPLLLVVGFLGGAFWGAIPGLLRAKFKLNMVVTTIMLNFVAMFFINYLVFGPMREPGSWNNWTVPISFSARLPKLILGTRLHVGFFIAIVLMFLVYLLLQKMVFGARIKAVGLGPEAASYMGIPISKTMVLAMIISGGLAGLAGIIEISGIHHRLFTGFTQGYGYLAIITTWLGKAHPIGVSLGALFFAALISGGEQLHRATGLPRAFVAAIQGIMLLTMLLSEYLVRRKD